jgi:hypothetical protein
MEFEQTATLRSEMQHWSDNSQPVRVSFRCETETFEGF